jgi:hypothetical protein
MKKRTIYTRSILHVAALVAALFSISVLGWALPQGDLFCTTADALAGTTRTGLPSLLADICRH